MLGYIYRHFEPRVIYIMRHPCAVIHSSLTTNWRADIGDILAQKALVEDYLQPWVNDIKRERDQLGIHAVWWAAENYVALKQLQKIPHFLVYYEDLVMQPDKVLAELFRWLGYDQIPKKVVSLLSKPSRTSGKSRNYINEEDRLTRWQKTLSKEHQSRILSLLSRMGLTMYDETPLPVSSL